MQDYLTGNIVIEDGVVQLQLEDGRLVTLDNSYFIQVLNGARFESATINKMLQAKDEHGWSIYCGLYASAEIRKELHEPINEHQRRKRIY